MAIQPTALLQSLTTCMTSMGPLTHDLSTGINLGMGSHWIGLPLPIGQYTKA